LTSVKFVLVKFLSLKRQCFECSGQARELAFLGNRKSKSSVEDT